MVYRIDIIFKTIQSDCFHSPTRFRKVCVISFSFYSIHLFRWPLLFGANIASSWSPLPCVSALYWYYRYYDLVYVINIIHMTYIYVYTIYILEYYRSIIGYSPTPGQQVSVILWNITITVWLQSQVHRVALKKCMTFLHHKI